MTELEYWRSIAKAREDIYQRMIDSGIVTSQVKSSVNPYGIQIIDNGGIGLELLDGKPIRLYTPLGSLNIRGEGSYCLLVKKFIPQLKEDYGLVQIEKERYGMAGHFGPVYAITRLPWSSEVLPIFVKRNKTDYIDYDEAEDTYKRMQELAQKDPGGVNSTKKSYARRRDIPRRFNIR